MLLINGERKDDYRSEKMIMMYKGFDEIIAKR